MADEIAKILKLFAVNPETVKFLMDQSTSPDGNLHIIIIDIRRKEEFLKGHIDYKYCICIPGDQFNQSTRYGSIKQFLADAKDAIAYRLWRNLDEFDKVIIYDQNQKMRTNPQDDKLTIFFKLVEDHVFWRRPSILKGGFENFRRIFPDQITSKYTPGEFLKDELPRPIQLSYSHPVRPPRPVPSTPVSPISSKQLAESIRPSLLAFWKKRREKREGQKQLDFKIAQEKIASKRKSATKQHVMKTALLEEEKNSSDSDTIPMDVYRTKGGVEANSVEASLPRGIINRESSCYLGVILQCLGLSSEFFRAGQYWLSQVVINRFKCKWTSQVLDILTQLKSTLRSESVSIDNIKKLARSTPGCVFGECAQQDAYEFLGFLLCRIHEELSFDDMPSPLREMFEIATVETLTRKCVVCGKVGISSEEQSSFGISLPLGDAPSLSLESCLKLYTEPQELSTGRCQKCGNDCNVVHQISLRQVPRYLIFHLKRFRCRRIGLTNANEPNAISISKLSTQVDYPLKLDVKPFLYDGDVDAGSRSIFYETYAIVNHIGNSMESGHYTAYGLSSGTWFHYDDARVRKLKLGEMELENSYIFFLRRIFAEN